MLGRRLRRNYALIGFALLLSSFYAVTPFASEERYSTIRAVPFDFIHLTDEFWAPRIQVNRDITIPLVFRKCDETGILHNFARAAGWLEGSHRGLWFSDAQVYKAIEGAVYSLALDYHRELDRFLDGVINQIAEAQEEDGYLNTRKTLSLRRGENPSEGERFENIRSGLELYVSGHLFEAATAHYLCTRKRTLLEVAIKNADLLVETFGPDGIRNTPGHPEVEVGLMKLYFVTGDERYLNLVKFFIDERGHARGRELHGPFAQDHKPFVEQSKAVGQAPRATYLYSGVTDVARVNGDERYIDALDRIWTDMISTKTYITGGIGSRHENEGFGDAYELPNRTAYAETCAAISNSMWNHRMFLLHGDAKYIDVLERAVYNAFPVGVSLWGDRFFYANPLESTGEFKFNKGWVTDRPGMYKEASADRKEWFFCPCCPPNVVRFIPSVSQYMYATQKDDIYVNFFIECSGTIETPNNIVKITQETDYPRDGYVRMEVMPRQPARFSIFVRIPCWARGYPIPGGLYRYLDDTKGDISLRVDGEPVPIEPRKGFVRIDRFWDEGDEIELDLPMPIRRVLCNENVEENVGRVALERGPIVYCAEWADNGGRALNICLPDDAELTSEFQEHLLQGLTVIRGEAIGLFPSKDGETVERKKQEFTAIPYYAWSNRGIGEMTIWMWRDMEAAKRELLAQP